MTSKKRKNRTAIITGAARGIGAATAKQLAAHNINVVINCHDSKASAKDVAAYINTKGGNAEVIAADITASAGRRSLISKTKKIYGRIDILINNAGTYTRQPFNKLTEAAAEAQFQCNYIAPLFLSKLVVPEMRKLGDGVVINITSNSGLKIGSEKGTIYGATKAALIHSTKQLAVLLGKYNIRVNAIAPGYTNTRMAGLDKKKKATVVRQSPLGKINEPEDIADLVFFLVSPKGKNVTGAVIPIDSGAYLV